jgi:hypothetical protein
VFPQAGIWAVAVAMAWSSSAHAADLPKTYCPLERSPALNWLRLAQGDDCALDEDGNGLDDEIESQLAACFVPELSFDSMENSLRIDEPHVLFSAYAVGPNLIRLHFAFLFARDGGYVLGTDFPCWNDDHDGDVESVAIDVAWTERDHRWYGAPVAMHTRDPRDGAEVSSSVDSSASALRLSGMHPVLFVTAGKHHWLHRAEYLTYACSCGPLGRCGSVRDRADGAGPRIVPTVTHHAPGFYPEVGALVEGQLTQSVADRIRSHAPVDQDQRSFFNACAFAARGVLLPATHSLHSNDLTDLGYPRERVYGPCFRGGFGGRCAETISVAEALSWEKPFAMSSGARKLLSALLGAPGRGKESRRLVLLPLGAGPPSIFPN